MIFNMPKAAIFFSLLLLLSTITHSYAYSIEELELSDKSQNSIILNSDIIEINPNFLVENDFKRYLIFGSNLESSITS